MKAAMCRAFGPLTDVRIEEIERPLLASDSVRIQVALASANPPDVLMPQGKYQVRPALPFAIGLECAGVVTEVAPGVQVPRVGDRVMAYAGQGCFAQEVVAPAHLVYPMHEDMPFEDAAGFALVNGTAYHALVDRGELKAGETVAVLGAAGGIGLGAIQIAKALGARVIAVASTQEKLDACRALGADEVLIPDIPRLKDQLLEATGGAGVDVVLDTVGGPITLAALRGLRTYGRHLIVGYSSGEIPQIPGNYVLLKQVSVIGVSFRQCAQNTPALAHAGMKALGELSRTGKLRPPPCTIHPFENFADALNALSSRATIGKQLIRINPLQ